MTKWCFLLWFYNCQKKKKGWHLSEEKTEEKQNGATTIVSVNGNGEVVPMKLKLQEELFEKTY